MSMLDDILGYTIGFSLIALLALSGFALILFIMQILDDDDD